MLTPKGQSVTMFFDQFEELLCQCFIFVEKKLGEICFGARFVKFLTLQNNAFNKHTVTQHEFVQRPYF